MLTGRYSKINLKILLYQITSFLILTLTKFINDSIISAALASIPVFSKNRRRDPIPSHLILMIQKRRRAKRLVDKYPTRENKDNLIKLTK